MMNGKGIANLTDKIFLSNGDKKYWKFGNTVGQEWLFPQKGTAKFLSLFQPSSAKGKFLSAVLPYFRYFPFLANRINVCTKHLKLDKSINCIIERSFNITDFEFGVFLGSPGKHQKITLMINRKDECLGYCKISNNPEVFSIFKEEALNLEYLKSKGISDVPEVLFVGELEDLQQIYIFIQTTRRNGSVLIAKYDDKKVFDFVLNLYDKTRQLISYKDSDFAKSIDFVRKKLDLFSTNEKNIIVRSICEIEQSLSEPLFFSAYHGDFTPWNSFMINDRLYAFDLEYFQKFTIPYMDYFHFFTQSCIYDEYMKADDIYNKYMKMKNIIGNSINNPDFIYTCYLINVMAFYLKRDNGFLNERIKECFLIWINLIGKIKYEYNS